MCRLLHVWYGAGSSPDRTRSPTLPSLQRPPGLVSRENHSGGRCALQFFFAQGLPLEVLPVHPHAVHEDGELAGDRHTGFADAVLLRELHAPGLERAPLLRGRKQHGRRQHQMLAHHRVAALADAEPPVSLAGLLLARGQAEVSADISGFLKALRIVHCCGERQRHHRTHARHRHQTFAGGVVLRQCLHLLRKQCQLFA